MFLSRTLVSMASLLALACASTGPDFPDFTGGLGGPIVIDTAPVTLDLRSEAVEPEFVPLLTALQTAVQEREEQVARNILARLYAHQPEGRTLELAQAFERILDGRSFVDSLQLELAAQAHVDDASRYRVALWMYNESGEPLIFRPGPATLRLIQTAVDARGQERTNTLSRTSEELLEVTIPPGEPLEISLLEFNPPVGLGAVANHPDVQVVGIIDPIEDGTTTGLAPGDVLAVRYRWELDLRSGVLITEEDLSYPAMRVAVTPAERVWLSNQLPSTLVDPNELLNRVREGDAATGELMNLAVRIAPERREETVRLLEPELEALGLEAIERLAPALRWIAGESYLGGDPSAWRAWLRQRRAEREREAESPSLQLPRSTALQRATSRLKGDDPAPKSDPAP